MQTLSVPSALKKTFSQSEIHWITRKDMTPLLKNHPAIDKVWEFDRKLGLVGLVKLSIKMRHEGFTHVYDAHNNMRSRVIVWILRPLGLFNLGPKFIRRSIRRWKRFLLFRLRINTFEMPFSGQRDLLEPLTTWGVSKIPPPTPQMFTNEESLNKAQDILGPFAKAIALAPSAAHFLKRWPKDYWKELITLLPNEKFVLLGGPEDSFIDDICAVAPERTLNLAGKCSLGVSAGVVSQTPVLVSNDTWLLHAGEQLGIKTIALMGPAPFGFPCRASTRIMEIDLPCRPCTKHGQGPCVNKIKYHQCLVDITPQQIAQEIKILLGPQK
ncbi:MAG: glycosyltransferase family 9 protein [Pseudobdellovibrionaceae bacterium]